MPRTEGSLGASTRKIHKTLRETITDEEYTQVLYSLLDIALHSKSPNARFAACKFIVERIEGNLPQAITMGANEHVTVESILNDFRTKDTSE